MGPPPYFGTVIDSLINSLERVVITALKGSSLMGFCGGVHVFSTGFLFGTDPIHSAANSFHFALPLR